MFLIGTFFLVKAGGNGNNKTLICNYMKHYFIGKVIPLIKCMFTAYEC